MKTAVCTLAWGNAWDRYAQRFVNTFDQYWPADIDLWLVTDEHRHHRRTKEILLSEIEGYQAFKDKWVADRQARGFNPPPGAKRDAQGYNFRYDAMKWMPQALAPQQVMRRLEDGDIFVWFDADTHTTKRVRKGWIEELLGGYDVAAQLRPGTHTEIGFYAMRVTPWTRRALDMFAGLYTSGHVFALKEWHSAFVWDHCIAATPGLKVRSVATVTEADYGRNTHVWPNSLLAEFTVHEKGKRKFR